MIVLLRVYVMCHMICIMADIEPNVMNMIRQTSKGTVRNYRLKCNSPAI